MNNITIKPLTSELNADYLDFFDNRAFTDNNPNGPCYCTSPNQTEENIKQMVSEFKEFGVKETVRKYAVDMLNRSMIQGYLAYDGNLSIGWCNAADMESFTKTAETYLLNHLETGFKTLDFYKQLLGAIPPTTEKPEEKK